ncbi:MAG TPA: hypothetical protein VGN82_08115 [Bosea sp. (in: a-proteobacteria)]|jgi:hypothetical protein|uniref:hypothetical protein n=1 Tax=Bosea sp. (in: a-proteobacteria) TaxID=1871050 RepID=UPI002E149409|nr:hypothetical protein [Bosea sp. (in: a-proteobacteria)]
MPASELKVRACCATGDLGKMRAIADLVAKSGSSNAEQHTLAAAALRSIRAELAQPSKIKHQVSLIRFAKLIDKL